MVHGLNIRQSLKPANHFAISEYCRIGPDGLVRYISISGVPIFDEEGRFKGYEGRRAQHH